MSGSVKNALHPFTTLDVVGTAPFKHRLLVMFGGWGLLVNVLAVAVDVEYLSGYLIVYIWSVIALVCYI